MSTRRLIAAALVCGLAILLAGGVFLVNLSANRDELTVPDIFGVGQTTVLDGVRVTVLGSEATDDVVRVRVRLQNDGDGALTDAAEGWALVIGGARDPVEPPVDGVPCAGRAVPAGGEVECELAFAVAEGTGYVEYARGESRARWRLG